jgi:hypothetical protein
MHRMARVQNAIVGHGLQNAIVRHSVQNAIVRHGVQNRSLVPPEDGRNTFFALAQRAAKSVEKWQLRIIWPHISRE